jgi:hypothetical protein
MKKIAVVSGSVVVLLTAGVSIAEAQVSIILNSPGYGYVYPNFGYNFYSGPRRGGCGGYNNYGYNNGWGNGYRGGYGNNHNGWGNAGPGWNGGGRDRRHHHGCR